MPNLDGLEATRRIFQNGGGPRVLMLTTFDLDEYVYEALRAGASGFMLKDTPPEQLVSAIHVVASGDALLSPTITKRVIEEFIRRPPSTIAAPSSPLLAELTAREFEVLGFMARGLSNAEIAKDLFVSETTVKTHVARILMKLDLRDRVQAVVFAYETGDRPARRRRLSSQWGATRLVASSQLRDDRQQRRRGRSARTGGAPPARHPPGGAAAAAARASRTPRGFRAGRRRSSSR